jgi:uncharacterized protein (UPF0333 family)
MRKTLILTLVLCVFAVIAYAQTGAAPATSGTSTTTSTTTSATGAGTATTTTKTTHKKAAAHCTFKCTVVSVDAPNKSFVCHPAKGDDITVKTNENTKWSPKKTCTLDSLKAGDKVSGTCKKDGADTWALTVKCWPAPKAKAEPAAKSGK